MLDDTWTMQLERPILRGDIDHKDISDDRYCPFDCTDQIASQHYYCTHLLSRATLVQYDIFALVLVAAAALHKHNYAII